MLVLFYEDLKKDLGKCVDRIAEFLNIPMSAQHKATVLALSSIEHMRSDAEKYCKKDALRKRRSHASKKQYYFLTLK